MQCTSCHRKNEPKWKIGNCGNCCKKDKETNENLNSQVEDLTATLSFLRLSSRPFHDIVLVASDGSAIPANRTVLASCSPVFRTMLKSESIGRTIEIGDVSHNHLEMFVNFLYTAEANNLDENTAFHLIDVADKYQVPHLKAYCEKFLISTLNGENSIPIYRSALKHNADHLLDACLSDISDGVGIRFLHYRFGLKCLADVVDLAEEDLHIVTRIFEYHHNRCHRETERQTSWEEYLRDDLKLKPHETVKWSDSENRCFYRPKNIIGQYCKSCWKAQEADSFTGNCIFCCNKGKVTGKKLKSQAEDLSAAVNLLRLSWSDPDLVCFSDVSLVASDDPSTRLPISANRTVLAARSPVFRAMLETEMEESITRIIKIGRAFYDALKTFVNFLYTGEANNLDEEMACDIMVLADMYQILHLKNYCEKFLKSILTWENSLPLYAFASKYNAQSLLSDCLGVLVKDMNKLPQREDYAHFLEKDRRMMLQIYLAYSY